MTRFLKIVGSIFVLAMVLVTILSLINRHYINSSTDNYKGAYSITPVSSSTEVKAPTLPDLTPYSAENIKKDLPSLKSGVALVEEFSEAIRKLRSQEEEFGDMQGRLDAVAITIVDGVYGLDQLVAEINDDDAIQKTGDGEFILHIPIAIKENASLLVQEGEILRLNANTGALIYNFGYFGVIDATVHGWNVDESEPAYFEDQDMFRPFFTTWCGGVMDIVGSDIAYLGYQSSKSYGITYTSCDDSVYRHEMEHAGVCTGSIIDSKFTNVYFGFYSFEAEDVAIIGNEYDDNIIYGIDPHDWSRGLIIANNTVRNTRVKHGIITSRGVHESYIFNNLTENNNGSGIMLDRNSYDIVVANNVSRNNKADGLTVYESSKNISYQNKYIGNGSTGIRSRNSWDILSYKDVVNDNNTAVRLYTADLTVGEKTKDRDFDRDPYTEKSSTSLVHTEIIGNHDSNFQIKEIDSVEIYKPSFFKVPQRSFSGEFKKSSKSVFNQILENDGLVIEKKN